MFSKSVGNVKDKHGGLVIGTVSNIVPDGAGADAGNTYAVRVQFPSQSNGDTEESHWARVSTLGAGKNRGIAWLPEIGDEVIVAFLHGDFNRPVILGTLWNGTNTSSYVNKDASGQYSAAGFSGKAEAKKNDIRSWTSWLFHPLIYTHSDSEPRVALHSNGKHRIVLDDKSGALTIQIYDGSENNYILIDSTNNKITMEAKTGDILIKAKNKIQLQCNTLETTSDDTKITAGANFTMNASANMTMKASGNDDIESSWET